MNKIIRQAYFSILRSGSGSEIFDRLPDSGLHGDELDSPGSEDSDVYSQIDSLDRHSVSKPCEGYYFKDFFLLCLISIYFKLHRVCKFDQYSLDAGVCTPNIVMVIAMS